MTPVDWYFARGNKQMGPVSAADLKRLAAAGELLPDDLIWREGLAEWTTARSVRGLFDEESKPAGVEETPSKAVMALPQGPEPAAAPQEPTSSREDAAPRAPARHPMESLLDGLRNVASDRFLEATARRFRACGLYGLLAAMVVSAAFMAIVIVKTKTLGGLSSGITLLMLLAVLQYVAGKFFDVLDRLNRATGGGLASTAFSDGVALLSLVAGLAALFGSVATAVAASMVLIVLGGIASLIIHGYLAGVALNPASLGMSTAPEKAQLGEETIGVIMFLLKALLRTVPVAFGVGVLCGLIVMGDACRQTFSGAEGLLAAQMTANAASAILISSAALPFVAYLLFLLGTLVIALCRALLRLPGGPDRRAELDDEQVRGL
jgi:hypothetical protein